MIFNLRFLPALMAAWYPLDRETSVKAG